MDNANIQFPLKKRISMKQTQITCGYTRLHLIEVRNLNSYWSVQSLSHVPFFATPWTAACQASLSITNSWSLLKLMSIELVMPSNHLIFCLSFLLLPSIFPSIRVFQWISFSHHAAKILKFQLQHESLQWIFRTDFLEDWLVWCPCSPRTLKSLLQHHSSKASIL